MGGLAHAIHIMLTLLAHAFLLGTALALAVFTCPTPTCITCVNLKAVTDLNATHGTVAGLLFHRPGHELHPT